MGVAAVIGGEKIGGVALAHWASLRFVDFSVKVVRHKIGESFCGRLWKRDVDDLFLLVRKVSGLVVRFSKPSLSWADGPAETRHLSQVLTSVIAASRALDP